jgi:hypothetical protein
MDGLFDAIVGVGNAGVRRQGEKDKLRLAKEEQARHLRLLHNQDRTPELVSDRVGAYQRSQSPIADAFLESVLTGQNPSAVQGTRAGASGQRAAAQRAFDQQTGGMAALRDRQRRAMAGAPWLPDQRKVPLASRLDEQQGDPRALAAPPKAPPTTPRSWGELEDLHKRLRSEGGR